MTGRHAMLAGDPGCVVDFSRLRATQPLSNGRVGMRDGLKIVWTSEVASTAACSRASRNVWKHLNRPYKSATNQFYFVL
jgi:hypothetical protein